LGNTGFRAAEGAAGIRVYQYLSWSHYVENCPALQSGIFAPVEINSTICGDAEYFDRVEPGHHLGYGVGGEPVTQVIENQIQVIRSFVGLINQGLTTGCNCAGMHIDYPENTLQQTCRGSLYLVHVGYFFLRGPGIEIDYFAVDQVVSAL